MAVLPAALPPVQPFGQARRSGAAAPPWWLAWAVGAFAFVVRAVRLDSPPVYVFDEIYYVGDAASLLRSGIERGTPVHPPLGKWLIGLGIQLFGMNPAGWRVAAVLAGAVVCAVVAVIAWHWTGRLELALLAGALCTVDGILFTASRTAMLDIFEAMFVVLFAHACTLAVQRHGSDGWRWTWLAALWLGLGAATKWSALYCLPVLIAVIAVRAWRTESTRGRSRFGHRAMVITAAAATCAAITLAAYLVAFLPTFLTNPSTAHPGTFIRAQLDLVEFHLKLEPRNTYAQPAVDWLAQRYPTGLLIQACIPNVDTVSGVCPNRGIGTTVMVVSLANPVVWLLGVAALVILFARTVYVREASIVLALGLVAARWIPWLFTRSGYSFYAASLVPFLVLGLVGALALLPRRVGLYCAIGIGAAAIVVFAFFYPYLAAVPMTDEQLRLRQWLDTWP